MALHERTVLPRAVFSWLSFGPKHDIGQYENDPVTLKRDGIFTEAPQLLQVVDVVLIKRQTVDTEAGRIEKLIALLPDAQHRIILLSTPSVELKKRLPNKSWWDDDDIEAFIKEETKNLKELIDGLKERLLITEVSGNNDNYSSTIVQDFNEPQLKKFTKDGSLLFEIIEKIEASGYTDAAVELSLQSENTSTNSQ